MPAISNIQWFRFTAPLRRRVELPDGAITVRSGLIVKVTFVDGQVGWGEASPLPGFHGWLPVDDLEKLAYEWSDTDAWFREPRPATAPSLVFAVSCALEWPDLMNRMDQNPPAKMATAVLIDRGEDLMEDKLRAAKVVKVKVGGHPREDIDFVKAVRRSLPAESAVRVDANRRWTFAQAAEFARGVEGAGVEFIEEPFNDPTRFRSFHNETGLAVAADESLQEAVDNDDVARLADDADVFVIKPTMLGSLARCRGLIGEMEVRGKASIISSAFESGIGMLGILSLISESGSQLPPGIGTYTAIEEVLLARPLDLSQGEIDFSKVFADVVVKEENLDLLQ